MPILGADGRPIYSDALLSARNEIATLRRQILSVTAKYDAAQTVTANENHWANADNLDPHAANSPDVRRTLRNRSRYEVVENNPYLKGIFLTICNDFVGSGPKLQITDPRWKNKERRRSVEREWNKWAKAVCLRQKLWRARMQKGVDGEAFLKPFYNLRPRRYTLSPILLDFELIEAERCASWSSSSIKKTQANEVDGVRFDQNNEALEYHLLSQSPGGSFLGYYFTHRLEGKWINSDYIIHWFRQDRGWLRGIPETTTCLSLCALLRRYTLAVVRAAEIAAAFSAVLETEGPAGMSPWTDGNGNMLRDDPFDTFPFELGMITTMPYGYKLNQLEAKQPIQTYDIFVEALLREISRPLLVPFNISSGSSKDSNMASAVVDTHIYRSGQTQERYHCEDYVLTKMLHLWWDELALYDPIGAGGKGVPEHRWRWDPVGLDHTDPVKVATSLQLYKECGILTDRDIQEGRFNRDYEEWQEEITEDLKFRKKVGLFVDPNKPTADTVHSNKTKESIAKSSSIEEDDDKPVTKKSSSKRKANAE